MAGEMRWTPGYPKPPAIRFVFLNSEEDMQWLRDVHLPGLPGDFKSAIVYGNEDAPERVDVFEDEEPTVFDLESAKVYVSDEDGVLQEWKQMRVRRSR